MTTTRSSGPVHRQFEWQARRRPAAPAVETGPVTLTYAQLNARANQLARYLRALGVGPEDRVGTCLPRSADAVVSALGIVKAGAAPVLLDPASPPDRLAAQVAASGAALVVTSAVSAGVDPGTLAPARALFLDRERAELDARDTSDLPGPDPDPDATAHVVFTSGSSGVPKAVLARHETVTHCLRVARNRFGFTRFDRGTWVSAPGFGVSLVNELWPLLATGATVCVPDDETVLEPRRLQAWLLERRVTVVQLVGTLALGQCTLPWPAGRGPRLLLTTGERFRLPATCAPPFDVVVTYGSTETTHVTAGTVAGRGRLRHAGVGRPVPEVSISLLDEDGHPVPDGETGEVYVSGPGVARGYLGDPTLTAARFAPDPSGPPGARRYRTGDLGRILPGDALEIVGRTDRQVKVRGTRVNLDEVEAVLGGHVPEAAVVAVGEEQRIVAYLAGSDATTAGSVHRELAATLTPAQMPREIVLVDRLPRNANGKLDRSALPAPRTAVPDVPATTDGPAPGDRFTGDVSRLWGELLECTAIDPDASFFELGGHSLLAVRMAVEIEDRTGVRVDLPAFYDRPTIRALTATLDCADQPASLFVRARPADDALVRLVCFPFAGGGASSYATLLPELPGDVDAVVVQPPGRGTRLSERPLRRLDDLVLATGRLLVAEPYPDLVLFGHSLGAVVAFEVARWLRRNGYGTPAGLVVAGSVAPQTPVTARVHEYPDDDLLAHVAAMEGTPAGLLDDERLRPVLLPALRADFEMHETYRYRAEEPLECPITALAGSHDPDAPPEEVAGWRHQTSGPYREEVLPGGHFFVNGAGERLRAGLDLLRGVQAVGT